LVLAAVLLLAAILAFFLLLGSFTPGTGADLVDWDPAGRAKRRAERDRDDFDEMLELNNRNRRERGLPELDESEAGIGTNGRAEWPPSGEASGS
jgi:hypothetical protein